MPSIVPWSGLVPTITPRASPASVANTFGQILNVDRRYDTLTEPPPRAGAPPFREDDCRNGDAYTGPLCGRVHGHHRLLPSFKRDQCARIEGEPPHHRVARVRRPSSRRRFGAAPKAASISASVGAVTPPLQWASSCCCCLAEGSLAIGNVAITSSAALRRCSSANTSPRCLWSAALTSDDKLMPVRSAAVLASASAWQSIERLTFAVATMQRSLPR